MAVAKLRPGRNAPAFSEQVAITYGSALAEAVHLHRFTGRSAAPDIR
jgi:hypothetical protein